jgi:Sec-independent protein translocase protein TatA
MKLSFIQLLIILLIIFLLFGNFQKVKLLAKEIILNFRKVLNQFLNK